MTHGQTIGDFFARYLRPRPIRFYCLTVIICVMILLVVALTTEKRGRTVFSSNLGADFAAFYIAGSILHQNPGDRLYDFTLQHDLYLRMFPDEPADSHLPYLYPPYFVLPFTALAVLPYKPAFVLWLVISLSLYLGGLALLWRTLESFPPGLWLMVFLLSTSFMPFLLECWLGGQVSVWGLFVIALVLRCERLERPLLSGVVLSLCTYKPTLLLLALPMLLLTRRFSTLLGFGLGCVGIVTGSFLVFGWRTNLDYVNTMLRYGASTASGEFALRMWKYIDVNSSIRLMAGSHETLRWILTIAIVGAGLAVLALVARRIWLTRKFEWDLVWATTLTWTLVLNVYVPIYDALLLVPSVLLTTNALGRRAKNFWGAFTPGYKSLLGLLHLVPWVTQSLARGIGFQLYTLVVVALGVYQVGVLRAERDLPPRLSDESPAVGIQ